VFDAVGRKRMGQMLPPAWGISLVTAGNIDEIAHLHTRIAALEAEVHERDRAIQKLQRQLGADPDADLDISPFLQRGAAA
jgi:hypothetical protein